ncbi:MAG TPA: type II toxin-antitoxin system HicA family toxin [Methanofastidiosum sp.]|nr:type II toxin-antitoxin system HicA family toxin [Methanofastidiosum sp.]HPX23655.1 type II toxin-antitoxin system HicA family toxin [Methanofastidiosum sp.]HQC25165.1 type II toxin-antitoxin system HicA family toxin [Methanofastidiosum sp.]HQF90176.1 type II toxin-antitoxin system HicA family toxin [Methanofastidiosum sp.]HQG61755.1 type II toxin-antitoxin system HicA family toxin [Methanofastidiosum sp.]
MSKFPIDASTRKVIKTFELLGFVVVREWNHISMIRENEDGTKTPLTIPNHEKIKSSTLRIICRQVGVSRDEFIMAYENV